MTRRPPLGSRYPKLGPWHRTTNRYCGTRVAFTRDCIEVGTTRADDLTRGWPRDRTEDPRVGQDRVGSHAQHPYIGGDEWPSDS